MANHTTGTPHHLRHPTRAGLAAIAAALLAATSVTALAVTGTATPASAAGLSPFDIPSRGATVPFVEQEAEYAATNGTIIGPDRRLRHAAVRGVRPAGGHARRRRRVRRVHPHRAGQRDVASATACRTARPAPAVTPPIDLRVNGSLLKIGPGDLEVQLVLRRLPVQQQPGRQQPAPLLRRDPDAVRHAR